MEVLRHFNSAVMAGDTVAIVGLVLPPSLVLLYVTLRRTPAFSMIRSFTRFLLQTPASRNAKTGANLFRGVSWLVLAIASICSAYVFYRGWNQPLIEAHGFRQTQTALAAYWLSRGGDWLAYETPVLGAPWALPMEFPVYQWLVALAANFAPTQIEHIGRAVSYALFLSCLYPIRVMLREVGVRDEAFLPTAALMLAAPIYLFWSRTFMIESTALFMALSFVALHLKWLSTGNVLVAASAAAFAVLGILTKVTTLVPYAILALVLSVPLLVRYYRSGQLRTLTLRVAVSIAIAVLVLLALGWWITFSDQTKALNLLGAHLTSSALSTWNFGTTEQRLSETLWLSVIQGRAIPQAIGSVALFWVGVGAALTVRRPVAILSLVFLIVWASAFLIFTNLHIEHNYYQYSNAILLIAAFALVIAELANERPLIASALLVLTLIFQLLAYGNSYRPIVEANFSTARTMLISAFIREQTPRASAILVLGYDWSSEVAYYSERKAITIPNWAPPEEVEAMLSSPARFLGGLPLSAVVYCRGSTAGHHQSIADATLSPLVVSQSKAIGGCHVMLLRLD